MTHGGHQKKSKRRANTRERLRTRDGDLCWICKDKIDFTIPVSDDRNKNAATIDHLIPVSLGGRNAIWNKALAHRICNKQRGTKMDDVVAKMLNDNYEYHKQEILEDFLASMSEKEFESFSAARG